MGANYAGILGCLAFVVVLTRGLVHGNPGSSTIGGAIAALVTFAIIGWIAGKVAESTIDESVRRKLEAQWAEESADRSAKKS